ncbi:hypothetical protein SAMN04488118_101447 [Epibacterium ulvae]|uniref:Uncharacterized protein n=2 Tax=Epibacterium ulvae TaxID=1156985 RepID=A0A1G5PPY9_9RHOB|nr:hypothetical protein [Epibacterium ulvae]SCZ51250.1 hypothetical protein SAMN04488118_101447 [Epibacterium ulvae]
MPKNLTKEDVLRSFSIEEDQSKETLDAYLKQYPQFALNLIELSLELELLEPRSSDADEGVETNPIDTSQVKAALSGENAKGIAKELGFPRAVVAAFRDRVFAPETLPQSLVRRTASAASIGKAQLLAYLCMPTHMPSGLSMKATGKPEEMEKISFSDFVADLGLDETQKARLYDGGYDNGSN